MENRTILLGDVLDKIQDIQNGTIDVVITSPPYWGLRDYGEKGQWGLEADFHDYLNKLRELMNQVRRVLKDTGTAWINLGDTYASGGGQGTESSFKRESGNFTDQPNNPPKAAYRKTMAKSRMAIPERFYVQCIDDGWIARNHIPWVKPNSMPSSVKDRFKNTWESIFFFAKNTKYYFNLDAVRETPKSGFEPFNRRIRDAKKLRQLGLDGAMPAAHATDEEMGNYQPNERSHFGTGKDITKNLVKRRTEYYTERQKLRDEGADHDACMNDPNGKNPGDVFNITIKPYTDAHFATFPLELPTKILKCACPPNGTVLDPFFGSGTVGMAAEKLGLNWCGIELKPEYVDSIIMKRLDKVKNRRMTEFD